MPGMSLGVPAAALVFRALCVHSSASSPSSGQSVVAMAAAAPEAHLLTSNNGSDMTEDDWNAEAADILEEVLKTQKEVSDMLATHTNATSELEALKESCNKELQELQTDAWKLQMYSELERMSSMLEMLAPLANSSDGQADNKTREGKAGSNDDIAAGAGSAGDADLHALDNEIAALDKQISDAKKEMQDMMQMKLDLEKELQTQQEEP